MKIIINPPHDIEKTKAEILRILRAQKSGEKR